MGTARRDVFLIFLGSSKKLVVGTMLARAVCTGIQQPGRRQGRSSTVMICASGERRPPTLAWSSLISSVTSNGRWIVEN
jgi:hypothetical protein